MIGRLRVMDTRAEMSMRREARPLEDRWVLP
jgi:hypothetical protein